MSKLSNLPKVRPTIVNGKIVKPSKQAPNMPVKKTMTTRRGG